MFLMPDVSSNNDLAGISPADAKAVATVAKALLVKATEGATYTFAAFRPSVANARAAGLKTAAYHFVRDGHGVDQARYMWSVVKGSGVLALCIDWESGSRQTALDMLTELKSLTRGTGIRIGAYEGAWAREHGGGLAGCDFVIVPDYGVAQLPAQYKLQPYAAWQYTDGQHNGTNMPSSIPGIGRCDVSLVEQPALIFGTTPTASRWFPWWYRQGHPLRRGVYGWRVLGLKRYLRALGYKGITWASPIYGPGVVTAVTAFQRTGRLTADGVTGDHTAHALQVAKAAHDGR